MAVEPGEGEGDDLHGHGLTIRPGGKWDVEKQVGLHPLRFLTCHLRLGELSPASGHWPAKLGVTWGGEAMGWQATWSGCPTGRPQCRPASGGPLHSRT